MKSCSNLAYTCPVELFITYIVDLKKSSYFDVPTTIPFASLTVYLRLMENIDLSTS